LLPYFKIIHKNLESLNYSSFDRSIKAQQVLKQIASSKNRKYNVERPIIILDMDETLLSAVQEV
jgi:hypothetical protein